MHKELTQCDNTLWNKDGGEIKELVEVLIKDQEESNVITYSSREEAKSLLREIAYISIDTQDALLHMMATLKDTEIDLNTVRDELTELTQLSALHQATITAHLSDDMEMMMLADTWIAEILSHRPKTNTSVEDSESDE